MGEPHGINSHVSLQYIPTYKHIPNTHTHLHTTRREKERKRERRKERKRKKEKKKKREKACKASIKLGGSCIEA